MDGSELAAAHLARNLVSLRRARALTQEALAKAAGVPRSTIANLESGRGNPSLTVLIKVVHALGAPIDELLAPPHAKVRHWPAAEISRRTVGRGVRLRPLVPEPVPQEILTIMEFAPKGSMRGTPHLPGTREFFTCLTGRVTIFVVGARHDLNEGDVLVFPGNVAHFYQNPDNQHGAYGVSVVILAKAGV
jgi:transcriptional regulator with XRE-family HTH domain